MAIIFSVVCLASPVAGAPNISDGLWETTMTIEMPGMPAGMMQPFTYTSCITQKDTVPQKKESGCTMSDVKTVGNTVFWKVKCEKHDTTSEGKVTYAGTKFDGVIKTTTTSDRGKKTEMKSTMKGKRLGPCK